MISRQTEIAITNYLYGTPGLEGAEVIYRSLCDLDRVIKPGQCLPDGTVVVVVIEEIFPVTPGTPITEPVIQNHSVLTQELIGAGLACTLAGVSIAGVVGGVAAEVPSAGTSTVVVVVAWTGAVTSGVQCANGLVRLGAIWADPEGNTLQRWDQNSLYAGSILIVDALGVVSGFASLGIAGRNLWTLMQRTRGFKSWGLSESILKSMNRAERAQAIEGMLAEVAETPHGQEAIKAAIAEAEAAGKTLVKSGRTNLSVQAASRIAKTIDKQTAAALQKALNDLLVAEAKAGLATGAGIGASGLPSSWVGSASGSVNWLIHLVDGAVEG